ncbi:hypothetical protein [Saccharicrinis sp. GN24d3]|uniref:hypothetical protein n=1 Tax=Saccharicrinis sp. GN24d3 TaxID=3458416 RepID=UPI0040361EED
MDTFQKKHLINKLPKAFQLYGYGSFDESKPSLKTDFEEIGSEVINGKYMYDKYREFEKGRTAIKLYDYYKSIILLYIGFEDFQKFLDKYKLTDEENKKQLSLISGDKANLTYYYIIYYFGEDERIIKGKTIISNNWKYNLFLCILCPMVP